MTQPTPSPANFPATPFDALTYVEGVLDNQGDIVDELLVRVTRIEDGLAHLHSISLNVRSVRATVPVAQVRPLGMPSELVHKDGLVSFAL